MLLQTHTHTQKPIRCFFLHAFAIKMSMFQFVCGGVCVHCIPIYPSQPHLVFWIFFLLFFLLVCPPSYTHMHIHTQTQTRTYQHIFMHVHVYTRSLTQIHTHCSCVFSVCGSSVGTCAVREQTTDCPWSPLHLL